MEIFFILLQNIILRSGMPDQPTGVVIESREIEPAGLEILIANDLASDIDLVERGIQAFEAVERYKRDTALKLARQEGGSGLSKVWRIFEYDIGRAHSINLEVLPEGVFRAQLQVLSIWE